MTRPSALGRVISLSPLAAAIALATAVAAAPPLTAERGRSRPLVVVAPTPADPAAATLAQALAQPATRAAFAERQVVVFTVLGGQGARDGRAIDPAATAALLAGFGLHPDGPATILLVGKDGGVKLRRGRLDVAEILGLIDTMPMRRQEMR